MTLSGLAMIALVWSTASSAASWALFAECGAAGQQRLYSYDPTSITRKQQHVVAPVRADYSHVPGSRAHSAKLVWALDCNKKSFIERSRVDFGPSGRVVARYRATKSMNITPGSVADKLFDKVCA